MRCRFRTNIDCMKRFMNRISGLEISPSVGDLVQVYRDSGLEIELAVVRRTIEGLVYSNPELVCELHLPPHRWENLSQFEAVMRKHNIY